MDIVVFQQSLLVALVFAAMTGPWVARSSSRRQPVYGGVIAQIFHSMGAGAFAAAVPGVIAALIQGGGFGTALPVIFTCLGVSLLALLCFAVIERPARAAQGIQPEDHGWTAEDARTSGL